MIKTSSRLSSKLSVSIMLLAIPVFVLSLGIFYLQSRYLVRQEAMKHTSSILKTTVQHLDNYMNSIEISTNANAWLLEENFCPDSMASISQRILRLNPNILSCSVSTEPGMFPQYGHLFSVYTINDDSIFSVRETEYNYAEKAWYKIARSSGKASWVEPFSERAEGTFDPDEAVATYSRPLRSEKGDIIGVLSTDMSFGKLARDLISMEHPYPDAYFVLIGGDGRYFIHPDSTRLFRKTIFTDIDPRQEADIIALGHEMTEGRQGTMHVDVRDQRYHVCYCPVPSTDWSIAMVCPDDEVLQGFHRLAYVIFLLIAIGLLVMWWLCRNVVRLTIRPIYRLLSYTQHIAKGNYDEPIPHTDQNDAIGRLQNSFATMQKSLHKSIGSISQTAEQIRQQNEQRASDMKLAEEAVRKKTLFIQNLSHQIRTPLNIIMGFADVLLENIVWRSKGKPNKDAFHEESVNDISGMMKYNAIHLKRMVLMLFDSSSTAGAENLMANRRDEVSCNEVARESIAYTEDHFLGVKISLESGLSDEVQLLTNRLYLMRIIREVLYNAAKYSDGQHITLRVSETQTTIRFVIEDVGPGLPEDADDLLYKPFIKIDDLSEGLGLGLPLSKRHALSLGGDLIYDRSYKEGCRFIVEMPR